MLGAGGGTTSYKEIETCDLIVLWGSNAREAHPIFFHHLLKGRDNGAAMYAVDPRRTSSARFADAWLGLNVGTDIALANTVANHIISNGWQNREFIEHSTRGFDEFAAAVSEWTLERGAEVTGVPAAAIAELAEAYAKAGTAQIMWTLGITEHHNGVDNVFSLINLALLTGHVGRWGSGLVPLRGQNNVQGGADSGALPNKLPGYANVTDPAARARFEAVYGVEMPAEDGRHLTLMFEGMEEGVIKAAYIIGENPADSEADTHTIRRLLSGLDMLVVQDIFMTRTAELADVVLPASVGWAETDGTFTSSERRVQRVRAAVEPPEGVRHDIDIIGAIARVMGADWGEPTAHDLWEEMRGLSAIFGGMTWERLEAEGGVHWPCPTEDHPGSPFLHGWLWADDLDGRDPAPFMVVEHEGPTEELSADYPLRLTTGRVLDSYNTGVQSDSFDSPIRSGYTIDVSAFDAHQLGISDGERVKVSSVRGSIEMPVRVVKGQVKGLVFTTFHFPELADINTITNDAWDPKAGTAEFKAASIRIERLTEASVKEGAGRV